MTMDKGTLLARRFGATGEVSIPGVGTVVVRGLSRAELMGIDHEAGVLVAERQTLALAMVEPQLSEAEVEVWQGNSPADEISPIMNEVNKLSGIGQHSHKEAYKSVRE